MCECCLVVLPVISCIKYRLKRGISWKFVFGFSLFLVALCVPVHENRKHVQGWNLNTTASFPGRHNNNNKHREKLDNKSGGNSFLG